MKTTAYNPQQRMRRIENQLALLFLSTTSLSYVSSLSSPIQTTRHGNNGCRRQQQPISLAMSESWEDNEAGNSNSWGASTDENFDGFEDWQEMLAKKNDGSFWSGFESSSEEELPKDDNGTTMEIDEAEVWLDTLASISAEEVEFNRAEAEKADKVRQMQEWGFENDAIENTFGVAVDDSLEKDMGGMKAYREESYIEEEDWADVESHTKVERDPETGEPIRAQMVYVDEHTCIGCTNCAMIAQSTFFMHDEHGRARVFQQWGDDDETIQIAIETCPVDCIHYVPYQELERLEVERRDQNINFKSRLVNQAENGIYEKTGGAVAFSAPQQISGNMASRCNNCPSRGCATCPMFGVGKNPEFERKEKERKERMERKRIQEMREEEQKSADL